MKSDAPAMPERQTQIQTFDGRLGRMVIDTHICAVNEGLRDASAYDLFDGYCQRLVVHGVPLWRAHAALETLHPQWSGYGYTWRRDLNAIQPEQCVRSDLIGQQWQSSPMYDLIRRARLGEDNPSMRRRLEAGPQERDFPVLNEFFAAGATDYLAQVFTFGETGEPAHGTGIVYTFAADRRGGFDDDDTALIHATLPGLSLAMKADAGYVIASSLLRTYLGEEPGRRVHAGAIERGSVESIHAVLWYADIRGFTPTSDTSPGPVIIDLLNSVFEALTAALRSRGGEVLKFLGDGMLATLSFAEADRGETCRRALDAAVEAMQALATLNEVRAAAGLPARDRRHRAARRGSALRQCRRDRPARLHGHRTRRQRGRAHRSAVRAAGPAGPNLGRIRRLRQRHRRPPGVARPLQFARRPRSEGDFRVGGCRPSLMSLNAEGAMVDTPLSAQ